MPWIEPEYLQATIYLYPSEAEAEDGVALGGSGFLLGIPLSTRSQSGVLLHNFLPCVVTNKHVASMSKVVRINRESGKPDVIALDQAKWFDHPVSDVTLCPMTLDIEHQFACVSTASLITKEIIEQFDIGPDDDIFISGRFVNHEGKQRNTPSLRFGNIAQMPHEPITAEGLPPQESFLVEAKSIPGYSGSPVYVYLSPQPDLSDLPNVQNEIKSGRMSFAGISAKRLGLTVRTGPWLLGVDWCHLRSEAPVINALTGDPEPNRYVITNTGMSGVVPAWKIQEILDTAEMQLVIAEGAHKLRSTARGFQADLDSLHRPRQAGADVNQAASEVDANPDHREDFMRLADAASKKRSPTD
jgi:hypothetical protein